MYTHVIYVYTHTHTHTRVIFVHTQVKLAFKPGKKKADAPHPQAQILESPIDSDPT